MTRSGGSVALNGFLYQILHHLDWSADVSLTGTLDRQEVKDGCVVLEPRKGGGDAQAHASGLYLVEQYKTRASGTWSLSDVIAVLRDLRKSVPEDLPEYAQYRFVTNGRSGRLAQFREFIARLKSVERPDELDNATKREFASELCLGDREFLDHLAKATRNAGAGSVTPEERALVFHLARRFEVEFGVGLEELSADIETRLRPCVENLGDEIGVRKRLVGELMERLAQGETRVDRDGLNAMLQEAGISPDRLRKVAELSQTLAGARRRGSKYIRYRREDDVRDAPGWSGSRPVCLIAGESGAGKSWQLASLMETMTDDGEPVVFVRGTGTGTAEEILTRAAREIWQVGLGNTSDKTLQGVSNFLRDKAFQLRSPRFTIAVDDVRDADVVRELVRQDWMGLGARLAMAVPLAVVGTLGSTDREEIGLHRVGDFSIEELDALLKGFGQRWSELPGDLKLLLRKPVLAGLYLDLGVSSFRNAPQSEYEIFQAFWDRIDEKCSAGDKGIVAAVADRAVAGAGYPLPREHWSTIGLDKQSVAALEAAGWLTCSEHGEVEFSHDRLLNWAVAQSLRWGFLNGRLPVDRLFALMTGEADGNETDTLGRFGYVPMDTLWLLWAEDSGRSALGQLVEKMEGHRAFGGEGRSLYTRLLPTLGERAVPVLLQRLETIIENTDGDYRVGLIGEGFATLAMRESVDVGPAIELLLQLPSWDAQSVAVRMLTVAPDLRHMDRLWELHQQRLHAREHNADRRVERGYQATFAALRAGVARCPDWLRARILEADPAKEQVSDLGYLLSGLDGSEADAIWREVRDELMEKVPGNNPRCVLQCIARFSDHEKKSFVVEHLSHQGDIVSAVAMVALAVLNPGEAIGRIGRVDDEQRFLRGEWLPLLLKTDSERTRAQLRELARADSKGQHLIEDYFEKRPADLDGETLDLVLRIREKQFREHLNVITTEDRPWPLFPLRFLGRTCRPCILRRLNDEAGSALEAAIVELACSRLRGNSDVQDHILESARLALVLIGGSGFVDLINRELESEHFWVRHGGLNWARIRGSERTIELLAAIARRPIPRDVNGEPDRGAWQEFYHATVALAVLGADEILVEILSSPGFLDVPLSLADCRAHRGPMSKSLTARAVQAMRNPDTPDEALCGALVVAWLSEDEELVPDVRSVLERVEPESKSALHACIALQGLGDKSPEFARAAERLAFTKKHRRQGLNALIGLDGEGVEGLRRWLHKAGDGDRLDLGGFVIRALYAKEEGRDDAIEAAADLCRRNRMFLRPLNEIAAESSDRSVRERVLEAAFTESATVVQAPLDAMRGLAKFDAARAAEAIEVGLSNHPRIEREICRLLVQLESEGAAEKLVSAAIAGERESLSDAVGRALRLVSESNVSDAIVKCLHGTEAERLTACRIAGWLPFGTVAEALDGVVEGDSSISVRRVALDALYRHREEAAIRGLFSEFAAERCEARQWAIFVAIVETADPHLLGTREDALWLGHILTADVPYAFEHHARAVIERRKRKT